MAAAIAASAMTVFTLESSAQTTGGGIGAAVNGNAGARGLPTQGTTGAAGGTTTSGVAAPNAPANPLRAGAGPGINNTGSPVLPIPSNLSVPIGGGGGNQTARGTSRIPGNAIPVNPRLNPPRTSVNGAAIPQPTTPPVGGVAPATGIPVIPNDIPQVGGTVTTRRPGVGGVTGTITDFTPTSITFREGANNATLNVTADTVVQMDGRNITLNDIPANSQVRIERDPRNPNQVQRIVVIPQAAAGGTARTGVISGGTSVNTQTGTGSTGSANRSLRTTGPNDTGFATGGTSVNTQTGTGSTGSANTAIPNQSSVGDFGGATSATTTAAANPQTRAGAGDFGGATSAKTAAGSSNPQTRAGAGDFGGANPVTPGTAGNPQNRAGLGDFGGATSAATNNTTTGNQQAVTDGSQFLGPVTGGGVAKPGSNSPNTTIDAGAGATFGPNTGGTNTAATGQAPANPPARTPQDTFWMKPFSQRLGMQMNDSGQGLTVGSVSNQSLAARSGLHAGDHIQSINGTNVSNPADFARALQSAPDQGQINASVMRNGTPQNVTFALPNDFFNGINIPPVTAGVTANGVAPLANAGNGNIVVAPDGSTAVNAGGVLVPASGATTNATTGTGVVAGGAAGVAVGANQAPAAQVTTQESTVVQGQQPTRVRPVDPPVAAHRAAVTTEALKVPEVNLGWNLKATPEGVVMSSIVADGIAAANKFEPGDIIESIGGRPVTSPGAVSYELHRHRAEEVVPFTILRDGRRFSDDVTLPKDHKPLLLERNETFGQANNEAKDQGGSGAKPVPVKPTEESVKELKKENEQLKKQLDGLKKK
jgi:S1-C subfamily serine protease